MNATNSLALILISLGLLFFVGKPAFEDISLINEEKQIYEDNIDRIEQVGNKKDELLTKLNQIPFEDRKKIETFLPTLAGTVRLIADIDGIASKHGISIESVDLGEVSTDTSRSAVEAPAPKYYDSKIIVLSFSSSYGTLVKFLLDLEESLRMVDIRSIDLGQSSSEDKVSNVYSYKVSAEIYWLRDMESDSVVMPVEGEAFPENS